MYFLNEKINKAQPNPIKKHLELDILAYGTKKDHRKLSTNVSLKLDPIADGALSPILKIDSRTESSVLVVSAPTKAIQSFTHIPAPINSEPLKKYLSGLFFIPKTYGNTRNEVYSTKY